MRIGGLQKFSLIDYPGKVACVIFTQGCNFRCGYCHNPELVIPECFCPGVSQQEVFDFLKSRKDYLQGVVVSGGEPTIHADLPYFLKKIKDLGYAIKLDTNGSQPDLLRSLLSSKLVDYIAMDVKTSLVHYAQLVGVDMDPQKIKNSIELILSSQITHEFRTTLVRPWTSREDLEEIRDLIQGARRYHLQKGLIDNKVLDKRLMKTDELAQEEFEKFDYDFAFEEAEG